MKLTAERLRYLLHYDPESGLFVWKNPQARNVKVGQVAGSVGSAGYLQIMLDRKKYQAHRLAHLHMTGEWPVEQIDHINLIKSDNRWSNLRAATQSQNQMNRVQANNTSGRKGVTWNKARNKWVANIGVNGKVYFLGMYENIIDAATAYENIAKILHGEFNHFRKH